MHAISPLHVQVPIQEWKQYRHLLEKICIKVDLCIQTYVVQGSTL